jgi:hypothetical protein
MKLTNEQLIVGLAITAVGILTFFGLVLGIKQIVIFYHTHTVWFWV